jgi:hypothetical protein
VARSARFNANQTRTQVFKKSQHLCSAQRLTHNNFTLAIDSMDLKDTLGQIKADRGISIMGGSLRSWSFDNFHNVGTRMPGPGAIHPIWFAGDSGQVHSALRSFSLAPTAHPRLAPSSRHG